MCNTLDPPIEFKHKVALTDKTQIMLFFKLFFFFFFMIKFKHLLYLNSIAWFSDLNRSINCKREKFKIF